MKTKFPGTNSIHLKFHTIITIFLQKHRSEPLIQKIQSTTQSKYTYILFPFSNTQQCQARKRMTDCMIHKGNSDKLKHINKTPIKHKTQLIKTFIIYPQILKSMNQNKRGIQNPENQVETKLIANYTTPFSKQSPKT